MNKKIFLTLLLTCLFIITFCSYCLATTNVGNAIMNAGNKAGNAITNVTGNIVNGSKNLVNNTTNIMHNATGNTKNEATNTTGDIMSLNNTRGDYTATRTATNNGNFLGMSGNTWTWLILGIVGVIIVGLVWYYGAQYEHRNYNND